MIYRASPTDPGSHRSGHHPPAATRARPISQRTHRRAQTAAHAAEEPHGYMAITEQTLGARHRDWVTALPEIHILAVRVKSDTARQPCAGGRCRCGARRAVWRLWELATMATSQRSGSMADSPEVRLELGDARALAELLQFVGDTARSLAGSSGTPHPYGQGTHEARQTQIQQ